MHIVKRVFKGHSEPNIGGWAIWEDKSLFLSKNTAAKLVETPEIIISVNLARINRNSVTINIISVEKTKKAALKEINMAVNDSVMIGELELRLNSISGKIAEFSIVG